ncbi:hypothetical protein [Klebsiella variicola]|uniref:hypothetical protein n=1 Tax=Klebsiella variicola TaxID=244366 RepID=UPI00164B03F8|nr:hypothetical protein [Klebsiella variicola]MBC4753682.1 hypothetical protein [Klebsiella variicola]HDH0370148.1 hypothetical protein [Klebsiella variicola subsp. variicola]
MHCRHIGQLGTQETQTTSHVIFAIEAVGFFIQPEENQQWLFGLVLNIKTQLSGCGLYSLASINISRQRFPAVMPPYLCGGLRPRHFSLVLASTGRVLCNLRCFYIHFTA